MKQRYCSRCLTHVLGVCRGTRGSDRGSMLVRSPLVLVTESQYICIHLRGSCPYLVIYCRYVCVFRAPLRLITHWCRTWAFWTIRGIWATLGNFWKSKADILICAEFSTLLPCPPWAHFWAWFANWLVYWWKPLTDRSWKKVAMVWIQIHYVEFLTPSVMVLGGAAFRRGLGRDSG